MDVQNWMFDHACFDNLNNNTYKYNKGYNTGLWMSTKYILSIFSVNFFSKFYIILILL